jgi:hypothetical protein
MPRSGGNPDGCGLIHGAGFVEIFVEISSFLQGFCKTDGSVYCSGTLFGLPKIRLPRIGLPKIGLPKIGLLKIGLLKVGLLKVGLLKIGLPKTSHLESKFNERNGIWV